MIFFIEPCCAIVFFDRALFSDDFFDRGLFSDSSIGVYSGHFFPQPKNPLKPTKIIKNDRFSQQPKLIKNCPLQRDKKAVPYGNMQQSWYCTLDLKIALFLELLSLLECRLISSTKQ